MSQFIETIVEDLTAEVTRVMGVFSEILEIDSLEADDDFFGLGGDSFDAIRAISRIDKELKVVALFEHPTAKQLAGYMMASKQETGPRLVALSGDRTVKADLVVVGVPFGGGDPTSYMNLYKSQPKTHVYGVDFGDLNVAKSGAFDRFATEATSAIAALDAPKTVIYGHCAGSATAACLAAALEGRCNDLSLVVAAARPTTDFDAAIIALETTSDEEWAGYLRTLGAFSGLKASETKAMLTRGRRDHLIATEAFRRLGTNGPSAVPTLVLLGDADPATEETGAVISLWKERVNVVGTTMVDGGGHYFLRSHPQKVEQAIAAHIGITISERVK